MNDLYLSLDPCLTELRALADRAHYIMQDGEEDFFQHPEWMQTPAYLVHMFPRTAAKSGAVSDAIVNLRSVLDEIERAVAEYAARSRRVNETNDQSST